MWKFALKKVKLIEFFKISPQNAINVMTIMSVLKSRDMKTNALVDCLVRLSFMALIDAVADIQCQERVN